ncbi:MAG: HAMP domain-containing histidine kinase [Marmoricola sp.]|nr:HAMP domain-containing histidine kinase [Marmoricola sp.]
MSLRQRILLLSVAVAGLVLVAFAIPLVVLLQQAARESALEKGTDIAHGVADYASTSSVSRSSLAAYVARVNQREDAYPVRVDLPDGTHLGAALTGVTLPPDHDRPALDPDQDHDNDVPGSASAGQPKDPDHDQDQFARTSSAQVQNVEHGRVVTIGVNAGALSEALGSPSGRGTAVSVYVASATVRDTVVQHLLVLLAAALGALVIAALAAERVSRRLVRDLDATARTADELGDGDLTARAPESGPAEVRRVASALNRLAGRIDELLVLERETVADLSHRLRTPLTAVRLDVEALPDIPERAELETHLNLLERTLTAVIHAARRPEREGALPHCDAAAVVRARVEFWTPLLEDQGRDVRLELAEPPLPVRCAAADLGAAIDALLENVVAHTPDSTAMAVILQPHDREVVLEVRDHGPGIPQGALGRGASDRGSSGLGLDIARSCAESSGGRLHLSRDGEWTSVRLTLGQP